MRVDFLVECGGDGRDLKEEKGYFFSVSDQSGPELSSINC